MDGYFLPLCSLFCHHWTEKSPTGDRQRVLAHPHGPTIFGSDQGFRGVLRHPDPTTPVCSTVVQMLSGMRTTLCWYGGKSVCRQGLNLSHLSNPMSASHPPIPPHPLHPSPVSWYIGLLDWYNGLSSVTADWWCQDGCSGTPPGTPTGTPQGSVFPTRMTFLSICSSRLSGQLG